PLRASESEGAEQLSRPGPIPGAVEGGVITHRFVDAERGVEMRLLRHIAGPREYARRFLRDGAAEDGDASAERAEQSQHQPNRRRLAGAVGSEKAVHAPIRDVEGEVPDGK